MNKRNVMKSLLAGERPEYVPQWILALTSLENAYKLMPENSIYQGYSEYPESGSYSFSSMGEELLTKQVKFNEYIQRCAFPVGWGANAAFGHCGPGEFNAKIIKKHENSFTVEYETGAKRQVFLNPHYVKIFDLPVKEEIDLLDLELPNPEDPSRYEGFHKDVEWARKKGEGTIGWVNGIFSSVHYFIREYQEFFVDLLMNKDFAKRMIKKVAEWTIAAAKKMCEAGVDGIGFCDDLGSGTSMLISPEVYREFIWPWHKELCDMVHSYGAAVHMHSHGAIMPILKDLVRAGIDILNPLDPDDKMPIDEVREISGPHLVLCGGLDKHFFDWEKDSQVNFLKKTVNNGLRNGPYILMDSGGIPENITKEHFGWFLQASAEIRKEY